MLGVVFIFFLIFFFVGDYNQHAGGHWIYLCTD